jgi:hypothetical protein
MGGVIGCGCLFSQTLNLIPKIIGLLTVKYLNPMVGRHWRGTAILVRDTNKNPWLSQGKMDSQAPVTATLDQGDMSHIDDPIARLQDSAHWYPP